MVYCPKCGTMNAYDASFCVKCGAAIKASQPDYEVYWRSRHHQYRGEHHRRGGSGWGVLFAGIVIIIIGLTLLLGQMYSVSIPWSAIWALIVVFVGLWLVLVTVRVNRRRKIPSPPA